MIPLRPRLHAALRSERGGVSVEWVVLTAAVTGIFVAALDAEKAALRSFWFDVGGEVTGMAFVGEAGVSYDFDDGDAGGWSGAAVADVPGFGRALGPIAGSGGLEAVTRDFVVPKGAGSVTLTFDLYGLDSLDRGDDAVLYIGGREVARVVAWSGGTRTEAGTVPGVTVTGRQIDGGRDLGGYYEQGHDWSRDSITEITITVDDPGDVLSFGFGSLADQATDDESYALDNFTVRARAPSS